MRAQSGKLDDPEGLIYDGAEGEKTRVEFRAWNRIMETKGQTALTLQKMLASKFPLPVSVENRLQRDMLEFLSYGLSRYNN